MGLFNKKELKRIEELEKENAEYLSKIEHLIFKTKSKNFNKLNLM